MASDPKEIEASIAALEAQRAILGDAVVDMAVTGLRAQLAMIRQAPASAAQTLRQVSVLFLDMVGSTALAQRLDPEDIHAVMNEALARCTAIVTAHQGKVLQYAGDSLLAAFGADGAREDDPERAVQCGLKLVRQGLLLGQDVLTRHGHAGFNVRVGIHTGGVLLGGGVDAGSSIRGIAVNVAARMEQSAPPGGLRISQDTYAQVRGMFEVEPQDPILVKGVDQPLLSYLVLRAKPRAFRIAPRGIEGVQTRMIGRDAELELLQDAFKRVFAQSRLVAVTVVAEAGLGKSRLLHEFEVWSEARPESFYIFRGRATPNTQSQPYGLLRDVLAWRLQIADDDSLEEAKTKLLRGIVPLFVAEDGADLAEAHAHLLGHLIGMDFTTSRHVQGIRDDPRQIRNRAFHTAAQVFVRVWASERSPIVLQLEDLHWADDASLDFLNYLVQVDREIALLILGFARPTLYERRNDWRANEDFHQRIDLAPLDKGHARDLARELLKKLPEVPAVLRELLTGGAEGNPFYMEELVKMLIDQGAIETQAPQWTLRPEMLLTTQVPSTLTGVLQARLDGLPAAEKQTLQEASIIGHVFWDQALLSLSAHAGQPLQALVRRELTLPRPEGALDGLREYVFRHQILHQVTYETVLKRTRRVLHGKVADWLRGLLGARANDFLAMTAEQYERADEPAQAAEFHAQAARHACSRFAHESVQEHVARGLALIHSLPAHRLADPDMTALQWRLLEAREETYHLQGRRIEQRADLQALEALAEALHDDRRRAHVAWRRSYLAYRTADWAISESAAREAMALAQRAGDTVLRLRAQHRLAAALDGLGDHAAAEALTLQGLALARELGLRLNEALFLNNLSLIASHQDKPMRSLELDQETLPLDREIGNRRNEAITLGNLGVGRMYLGAFDQAQRDLQQSLAMTRANGERMHECSLLNNLSQLALWQGRDADALALGRTALDLAVAVEARDWEAKAWLNLGDAELALGRSAMARQAYIEARNRALTIGSAPHEASASLARLALSHGDTAAALDHLQDLLAHLAAGGSLQGAEFSRLIEWTCHDVLAQAGDPRAAHVLEQAHKSLQATAATITDPALRQSFLGQIPEHRNIVAAWLAQLRPPR